MSPRNHRQHGPSVNGTHGGVGQAPLTPSGSKLGVLVVEDDHLVRIMIQLGLERHGFDVRLARNGPEAVDLYRKHRDAIAVVLLDIRMPGMDGPQTLDALRELNPGVPACFMSGDMGMYDPAELSRGSAAYVIAKPFLLGDLARVLRLLAGGAPVDSLPAGTVCHR